MKKLIRFLLPIALCFLFTAPAIACCTTHWSDTWTPQDDGLNDPIYFNSTSYGTYTYTYDITGDGFDVGVDVVRAYKISIGLYDDEKRDSREWAWIDLPGRISDRRVKIDYTDVKLGFSVAGISSLNASGTLDVTINRRSGDFYLGGAELTACGESPSAAPVPASAFLLGTGLVGLFAWRRKARA